MQDDENMLRSRKWFKVSLSFQGDELDVEQIGPSLELDPTYVGRKGQHIRSNPRYARHHSDLWTWSYPSADDVPFEDQLMGLLDKLETKRPYLEGLLSTGSVVGELFLGFGSENGQGGATFSSSLLARIASLGLMLTLDLYPPG
jgi:uncharacterized protein DUF4279